MFDLLELEVQVFKSSLSIPGPVEEQQALSPVDSLSGPFHGTNSLKEIRESISDRKAHKGPT